MAVDEKLLNMESNIQNAQTIKNLILGKMVEEGDIGLDIAEKWDRQRQIVIIKRNWWNNWKKIFNSQQGGYYYKILKI